MWKLSPKPASETSGNITGTTPIIRHLNPRVVAVLLLIGLGLWIVHGFLVPLFWSVILAIATYPIYLRLREHFTVEQRAFWAPLTMTLLIGLLLLGPLTYALLLLAREGQTLAPYIAKAQLEGLPPPAWLAQIPVLGEWAADTWSETLGTPEAATVTFKHLGHSNAVAWTKALAAQVFHRLIALLLSLLALFFLYRDAEPLARQIRNLIEDLFGDVGQEYVRHALSAVSATVNGLVLVGLGQGALLGIAYYLAGLPHPAMLGAAAGLLTMIPFAAPLTFAAIALFLLSQGLVVKAVALLVFSFAVIFVADHFVRPALIGGSTRLPFLWVFLGILGGVETFGLLGLFLGPTVMAVLISVWRDWTEETDSATPAAPG